MSLGVGGLTWVIMGHLAPQCDICGFRFIKSARKVRRTWDERSLVGLKLSSCHTPSERAHFLQSKMLLLGHSVYRRGTRWLVLRLEEMLAPGGSSLRECVGASAVHSDLHTWSLGQKDPRTN